MEQTTKGRTNIFGSGGADTFEEAMENIVSRVRRAGEVYAKETTINVCPVGTPAAATPVRVIELNQIDGLLGLDGPQVARVRAAIGCGDAGPDGVVRLVMKFDHT